MGAACSDGRAGGGVRSAAPGVAVAVLIGEGPALVLGIGLKVPERNGLRVPCGNGRARARCHSRCGNDRKDHRRCNKETEKLLGHE